MKTYWRREFASDTNAIWFVGVEAARLSVLAPPGVSVSRYLEMDVDPPNRMLGWRWAIWNRENADDWPAIDEDPPSAICEVDTTGVLRLLDEEFHELVWACLWGQLQIARRIGRQKRGTVLSEDLARAGALSVAWLTTELTCAFPDRTSLLERSELLPLEELIAEVPDDPAELVQPLCADVDQLFSFRDGINLRSATVRWLTWKLLVRQHQYLSTQVCGVWRAGDDLERRRQFIGHDPGDRSDYSWGRESTTDSEPATEEFMQL